MSVPTDEAEMTLKSVRLETDCGALARLPVIYKQRKGRDFPLEAVN